jgi:hypothetical protein
MNSLIYKTGLKNIFSLVCSIGLVSNLAAQQNLFNVPSSEITEKKKIFFQQQFNFSRSIQSNSNFCYGLGKNMEIGLNLIGLQTAPSSLRIKLNDEINGEPIAPLTLLTFQKVLPFSEKFKLGLGTQLGTNLIKHPTTDYKFANFSYLNSQSSFIDDKLKLNAGIYYSNIAYEGDESGFGFMAGGEYSLSKKFHLVADWISGDNHIGVAVIGGMYYLTPKIPLSFGWQIPNDNLKNPNAFVFEFTYLPKHSKS